jgi:hypothetical protein
MAYVGNTNTTQAFTPAIDYFSGNGSTVAFTLSRPVASVAQVQVVVNNVAQNPTDAYTVLNNTITFTGAPSSGTNNIYVYYTSPITQVIQPGQGTVGTTQIQDSAVTTAKIANANVTVAKLSATGTPSSTTYLRGDGSWQTISTTPTTDQVLTATAGASAGAVGTYGLMNQTNATRYTQGATLAGSSLRFSDTTGGNSAGGATSSGTWRCMGTTDPFNTGTYNTLWLRIS